VSLTEHVAGNGPGSPPPADPETGSARRRGRFRWWWLLPPAGLVVAVLAILTALAATYQPVEYGPASGIGGFPGQPTAKGWRWVNTSGKVTGDLYVPPQKGPFNISFSIVNSGTHAVTIEGISLPREGPVTPAGPAQYYPAGSQHPAAHLLRNVALRPGDSIIIGILVRSWPCASKSAWTTLDTVGVRERFLFFTHTVQMPFSMEDGHLILHAPGGHQGQPDVFCASP
jgi:hypothetical protein